MTVSAGRENWWTSLYPDLSWSQVNGGGGTEQNKSNQLMEGFGLYETLTGFLCTRQLPACRCLTRWIQNFGIVLDEQNLIANLHYVFGALKSQILKGNK